MIVVSACLAGVNCRYNGKSKTETKIMDLVEKGEAILVCPEQLGGLSTPRPPAEQVGDKVLTNEGTNVTEQFRKGAEESLRIAKTFGCKEAILKSRSPSCGCGKVYDGTFSGTLVDGDGVFAKLLKKNNIKISTEEDL